MDVESLLRDSRAEQLSEPLGIQTDAGKAQWKAQLRKITSNPGLLQRRQNTILGIRKSLTEESKQKMDALFQTVKTCEAPLQTFFEKTEVESNSYQQLLFSGWAPLQVVNTIPFCLLALAYFKQYVVPIMAVLTPVFMIVMPYVFLRFLYNIPISTEQYIQILLSMAGLQNFDFTNPKVLLQGGLTLFSLSQSIYQPIQNALHLQTIHKEMMEKAKHVSRLVQSLKEILSLLPKPYRFRNPLEPMEELDIHRQFAEFWDHPYKLKLALQLLGDCEVVYRLACLESVKPVRFLKGATPWFTVQGGRDPFLSESIPFSLQFGGSSTHAILTGPNRGGKSSVLRSTLLVVVLAQTFGVAFADHVELKPFDWIATGLRLEDRPGSMSMFESEVDFAIQILQRAKYVPEKVGFVLFDELFHSTNPPDGARTAELFLKQLWNQRNVASFISTHVFELARESPKAIQKLCVPAHLTEEGSLHFTYMLQEGICEVSSVDEILREKGLLSA